MHYLRRPWVFLTVLFGVTALCFTVIKWHKFHAREARLCTPAVLCRLGDIPSQAKVPPVSAEALRPLLSQPLFFLGEGRQAVAYETADGRYVLKLFKKAAKKKTED